MSLADLLGAAIRILDESRIPCMLTGSLAAAYYALPRATQDVDFVIHAGEAQVSRLVTGLRTAGLHVSDEAAREALDTNGRFNAIDPVTGWKIDLITRKDRPFSVTEFNRRKHAKLLGIKIAIATLEDLILAKLEWSELGDSELQRRDVAQLVDVSWESIDRNHIEHCGERSFHLAAKST